MAVDMFMVFDAADKIKGETQDKIYKEHHGIDVLAWSWGVSQSGTTHMGSGGGAGKANSQDLSFTKHVRKAGGTSPLDYIKITMDEVIVTSISTGGSGGEDRFTENVTLNFAKVKVEYKEQSKKGAKEGQGQFTWDIAANSKD